MGACSSGSSGTDVTWTGSPQEPGAPVVPPPVVGPTDPPPGPDPDPTKLGCTRSLQAKSAPTTLLDAFKAEVSGLTGAARTARVEKFFADVDASGGAPLEDPKGDRVVFLARGAPPAGSWRAVGSFGGWDKAKGVPLAAIAGTDVWVGEATIGRGASHEYKLLTGNDDGGYRQDPLARNLSWDGFDRKAVGEFNAIVHPQDLPMAKGRVVLAGKIHATKLANDRDVFVYFPPRYDDGTCAKLPSVVFHDGNESLTRGDFVSAADALYGKRPELSAVLVFAALPTQDVRMAEYTIVSAGARGADYVDFLTSDLWPILSNRYRLCSKPSARGTSGASLGGLIATYAAFEKPASFGWVGAQSSSYFWADDAMLGRAAASPKLDIRFYLDSGCPGDNCDVTDRMATTLKAKGYDAVRITEKDAAHDWSFWRGRMTGLLTHFRDGQTSCD